MNCCIYYSLYFIIIKTESYLNLLMISNTCVLRFWSIDSSRDFGKMSSWLVVSTPEWAAASGRTFKNRKFQLSLQDSNIIKSRADNIHQSYLPEHNNKRDCDFRQSRWCFWWMNNKTSFYDQVVLLLSLKHILLFFRLCVTIII